MRQEGLKKTLQSHPNITLYVEDISKELDSICFHIKFLDGYTIIFGKDTFSLYYNKCQLIFDHIKLAEGWDNLVKAKVYLQFYNKRDEVVFVIPVEY